MLLAAVFLSLSGCTYNVRLVDSIAPAPGEDGINGVATDEDRAFYCKGTTFYILDASAEQRKPVLAASLELPEKATARAVSGNLVFLLGWYGSGLMIIDVSDTAAPRMVGRYAPVGYDSVEGAIAIVGTTVYIASNETISAVDVSSPDAPALLNSIKVSPVPFDMAGAGMRLLGTCGFDGLYIADVADPKTPVVAGTCKTGSYARGIAVQDSTAYVAAGWGPGSGSFQIVDFSNPAQSALLSTMNTSWLAGDVAVAGSLAYVTDGKSGVRIVDISDPRSPCICGSYRAKNTTAIKVAASRLFAFVIINTGWQNGNRLDILEFHAGSRNIAFIIVLFSAALILLILLLWIRKHIRKPTPQCPAGDGAETPSPYSAPTVSLAAAGISGIIDLNGPAKTERSRIRKRLSALLAGIGETLLLEAVVMIAYGLIASFLGQYGIILSLVWVILFLLVTAGLPIGFCVRNGRKHRPYRAVGNILVLLPAILAALYLLLILAFTIEGVP